MPGNEIGPLGPKTLPCSPLEDVSHSARGAPVPLQPVPLQLRQLPPALGSSGFAGRSHAQLTAVTLTEALFCWERTSKQPTCSPMVLSISMSLPEWVPADRFWTLMTPTTLFCEMIGTERKASKWS